MMCFLLSKSIYLNGAISDGVFFNMKGETLHFVVCRCWAPSKDLYLTRTAWAAPFWGHMLVEKDGALLKTCEGNALFVELKNTWLVKKAINSLPRLRRRPVISVAGHPDCHCDRGSPESFGGKGAAWIVCFYFQDGWGHIWAMNVGSQGSFCWFEQPLLFWKDLQKLPKKVQGPSVQACKSSLKHGNLNIHRISRKKKHLRDMGGCFLVTSIFCWDLQELRKRSLHFECREVAGGESEVNKLPRLKMWWGFWCYGWWLKSGGLHQLIW